MSLLGLGVLELADHLVHFFDLNVTRVRAEESGEQETRFRFQTEHRLTAVSISSVSIRYHWKLKTKEVNRTIRSSFKWTDTRSYSNRKLNYWFFSPLVTYVKMCRRVQFRLSHFQDEIQSNIHYKYRNYPFAITPSLAAGFIGVYMLSNEMSKF